VPGLRMPTASRGAVNLVDHVLPEHVPMRQSVLTLPYPPKRISKGVVHRARNRVLRSLEKRGLITFAAAPGDDDDRRPMRLGKGIRRPALALPGTRYLRPGKLIPFPIPTGEYYSLSARPTPASRGISAYGVM
jgi:hypothetical protein